MVSIGEPTSEDLTYLASHLRRADVEELTASFGPVSIREILNDSVARSPGTSVGRVDGRPFVIWGCAPGSLATGTGIPWLLGTDEIYRHKTAMLRRNRPWTMARLDEYRELINFVDARNTHAIHWLKWIGFKVEEPQPMGPFNMMFHRFSMRREPCAE